MQGKDIDLASVPGIVERTTKQPIEPKEDVSSSTWFKDHSLVFTDPKQLAAKMLWSQMRRRMLHFFRCIVHIHRMPLTISVGEWTPLI